MLIVVNANDNVDNNVIDNPIVIVIDIKKPFGQHGRGGHNCLNLVLGKADARKARKIVSASHQNYPSRRDPR